MKLLIKILLFIVAIIIQINIVPMINIFGVKPDIILVCIVCIALFDGALWGAMMGLAFGLALDMTLSYGTQINTYLYTFIGLSAGLVSYLKLPRDIRMPLLVTFCAMLLKNLILTFVLYFIRIEYNFNFMVFIGGFGQALYTVVFSLPIFFLLRFLHQKRQVGAAQREVSKYL